MFKKVARRGFVQVAKSLRDAGMLLPERVFRHLHFEGTFQVVLPSGAKLNLYSWGDRVENELAWRGWDGHEPLERKRWLQMVRRPGDILDIGANTGTFAFMAKAIQPSANVVAFEPLARIVSRIRKNVDISGLEVGVVQAAVSNRSGELPIYDPGGANAYSASIKPNFLPGEKEIYNVPVVSIDEYCAANGLNPTSIKIDVEGAELSVLLGAKELLARRQTLVLCEWLGRLEGKELIANLLLEIGLIAVDLNSLRKISTSARKDNHSSNILIGPAELICSLM